MSAPFAAPGTASQAQLPTNDPSGRTEFRSSVINLERPGDPSVFGESVRADAATLIARYPEGQARSALLPMLHLVQSEQGYISPDGIAFCADTLDLTKAQVQAVATFYTMYKRTPTGDYLVSVCTNTLCGMVGGDEIFAAVKDHLGIGNNQTTDDGAITIEHAECLAACDYAPVVTVNYEFYDNQTPQSTTNLLDELRAGRRPAPTRGPALCTFKQAERQIAGFFTDDDLALDATATGTPTEAGVRLAIERGETAPSYAIDSLEPKPAEMSDAQAREAEGRPGVPDEAGETTLFQAHEDEAPDATGESPLETPSSEASPADQAARRTVERDLESSENDAPLETAESDPANTTEPGAEKED